MGVQLMIKAEKLEQEQKCHSLVAEGLAVQYTPANSMSKVPMPSQDDQKEREKMSANLRRGIEITELALALRLATFQQQNHACTMADVMHEIRVAKERAWQANQT